LGCSMRFHCLVLGGSSAVSASLSLWAPALSAQEALATTVGAEASVALQSSTPASTEDSSAEGDFLHRYSPQANTLELGAFAGMVFISDGNSFRAPPRTSDGVVMPRPYSEYKQPAPELGARLAYFPLTFLGGELEGMVGLAKADGGESGTLWAGRVHVVAQAPFWRVVPFVLGGAGYWAVFNKSSGDDSDPAFHFGGGVKLAANDALSFRVDVRDTITNQRAVGDAPNSLEVSAGASLVLGRRKAPTDRDGDGYLDAQDACPSEAGVAPQGCPLRDRDGDQILDGDDRCPDQAGPAPLGCPALDADADGIPDESDQCVHEPGLAPLGCPDRDGDSVLDRDDQCPGVAGVPPLGCPGDSDQDGFADPDDKCPKEPETKNGFEDSDGCPDVLPDAVQRFTGVIAGIEFDLNKDSIRSSSFNVLDQAAKILEEYPSLKVEIAGHSDDTGAHDYNVKLSHQRADSVKGYLVSKGVSADRINTRGAGPDEPLVNEKTAGARQKNRRIEFRIQQ
jgi:outer membrane protein OmpA-like peptidoglycan-associated protein